MFGQIVGYVIAISYILLSINIMHSILPGYYCCDNKLAIVRMWCLSFAIGLFGIGKLFYFSNASIFDFAHIALIAYTTMIIVKNRKLGLTKWWETSKIKSVS